MPFSPRFAGAYVSPVVVPLVSVVRNLGVRDFPCHAGAPTPVAAAAKAGVPPLTGAVKLRRKKGGRELPHSKVILPRAINPNPYKDSHAPDLRLTAFRLGRDSLLAQRMRGYRGRSPSRDHLKCCLSFLWRASGLESRVSSEDEPCLPCTTVRLAAVLCHRPAARSVPISRSPLNRSPVSPAQFAGRAGGGPGSDRAAGRRHRFFLRTAAVLCRLSPAQRAAP